MRESVSIVGSVNNDEIRSGGNDYIHSWDGFLTVSAGKDDDHIDNDSWNASLSGGEGNDSIFNWGSNVTVSAGAGDDYIENYNSESITINGGDGDDQIYSHEGNDSLYGGDGDGSIVFQNVTKSTKFNINGTTYKVSGSKLK